MQTRTTLTLLLLPLLWLSCARGQALMQAANVYVSCQSESGMTPLGSISMKVCSETGCCFKDTMGGPYQDCNAYHFDGIRIGECDQFDLGEISADTLRVGLYHSGTDGGRFEQVRIFYRDGDGELYAECPFDDIFLDGDDYYVSSNCTVF